MTRLTPERQAELYTSVLELIAEYGYDKVTMDQIAAATHSSKATLYRQWGSKAVLVAEALKELAPVSELAPDTGSLREDLHAWATITCQEPDPETDLVVAVLHAAKTDEELASSLRERVIAAHRSLVDTIIERAIERGEVDAAAPGLRFTLVMFGGAFMLRRLIEGKDPDAEYVGEFIDVAILPMLGVSTTR